MTPRQQPLPTVTEFKRFYHSYTSMIQPLTASTDGHNIILQSIEGCNISLDIPTIIEIINEKINSIPDINNDKFKYLPTPPKIIEDMNGQIDEKLQYVRLRFKDMTQYSEADLSQLLESYHQFMSVPLQAKIKLCKFQDTLRDHHIFSSIQEIKHAKDKEIAVLKKRHDQQLNKCVTDNSRNVSALETELTSLRLIKTKYESFIDSKDTDTRNYQTRIAELNDKIEQLKKELAEIESKNVELTTHLQRAEDKIKTTKNEELWYEDISSKPEKPVYINPSLRKTIVFPCALESLKDYTILSADEDFCTYQSPDKTVTLTIPTSLQHYLSEQQEITHQQESQLKEQEEKQKEIAVDSIMDGLKPTQKIIIRKLRGTQGNKWYTVQEITTKCGKTNTSAFYGHLDTLQQKGLAEYDETTKKYRLTEKALPSP